MTIINAIYCIVSSLTFVQIFCADLPKISIDYIRFADNYKWIKQTPGNSESYIKYTESDYMVSLNAIGLAIVCRATYPVYWTVNLNSEDDSYYTMMYDIFTYMERQVPTDKFYDHKSFTYSSSMILQMVYKQLTGNYSCIAATDTKLQKSVYLYFENVAPPLLVNAGKTLNVTTYNKDFIILPCHVYNPDVLVYLFQETTHIGVPFNISDWIEVPISNSVSYDPKIGFTLSFQDPYALLGRYKCATNETEDFVLIDVIFRDGNPRVRFETNKVEGSAKYYWNTTNKNFYCCSNNKDYPPKMIMTYCDNHAFCRLQQEIMLTVTHNETVSNMASRQGHSSSNCSFRRLWEDTNYVMRCKGEGISLLTEIHPIMKAKNKTIEDKQRHPLSIDFVDYDMYTSWERNDKYNLDDQIVIVCLPPIVEVSMDEGPVELASTPTKGVLMEKGKRVFYIGETMYFYCRFSEYFLTRGNMWAVKMKNGTIDIIYNVTSNWNRDGAEGYYPYRRDSSRVEMILTFTKDMDSVVCYAPVWNSSEWASTSFPLEIKEPTFPKIQGNDLETVYWTLNETNMILQCTTGGNVVPYPSFTWTKDGSVIFTDNLTYTITKGNESTSLNVHLVSHEIHGQYACLVSNVAGKSNRTFNVFVAERHSLGLIIGGSASVILFLAALISFMYWKMNAQTNSLVNLRANVYAGH